MPADRLPTGPWGTLCLLLSLPCMVASGCRPAPVSERLPDRIDYNHHVKPILSDRCYKCHGPDDNARKADLRLDIREGAYGVSRVDSLTRVVAPGTPDESKLIHHVTATNSRERMPPPESNLSLSERDIGMLRPWIEQGAEWKPHWAFLPPAEPDVPAVRSTDWPRNAVDRFVLRRMEELGLQPAAEADRETLVRRVTFDLTGLPPTPDEIDDHLLDEREDAYEWVVDRLLASDAFGERMASQWLDVARYADTHGYQDDRPRTMWPWRDWVIEAFNRNLPYDRFVTWQIAGDLLPEATYAQRLATGFNRNHAITQEGGVVAAEYLTEYVADRTNTTATALLGLTIECARCHDHKFDPISQKDYYRMFAFFNAVDERAQISYFDLAPAPAIRMEDSLLEARIAQAAERIEAEEAYLAGRLEDVDTSAGTLAVAPAADRGLLAAFPLESISELATPAGARANTGLTGVLDAPKPVEGKRGNALAFDGVNFLNLGNRADFNWYDRFSVGAWIRPPDRRLDKGAGLLSKRNGELNRAGYELELTADGRLAARLVHDADHAAEVSTTAPVPPGRWSHVFLVHDGSGRAGGLSLYVNGIRQPAVVGRDDLGRKSILNGNDILAGNWTPRMKESADIAGFAGGTIDEIRLYGRTLSSVAIRRLAGADPSKASAEEEWAHYLRTSDATFRRRAATLDSLRRTWLTIPHVMVMEEADEARPTYVLARGAYDAPTDSVGPGVPEAGLPFPDDLEKDRLGLARWIVHPRNPLTGRVAVNRLWQRLFGTGIVPTAEDFGSKGALPSHPKLLDFLAATFVESGWDVKALQRLIVTSATYRQASAAVPALAERDPDNRLLARGPRLRLTAEMIRDAALAAGGLLADSIGGPSVKPYQPPGLWEEKSGLRYVPGSGDDLYRRSLYTFFKRTSPPPSMIAFDASTRAQCAMRRQRTTTPMQALVLLNDPQFVEAARKVAERAFRERGRSPLARLDHAFRILTGRLPTPEERGVLRRLHDEQLERFTDDNRAALAFLRMGESPRDESLDASELAATAVVASAIMNFDEAVSKR